MAFTQNNGRVFGGMEEKAMPPVKPHYPSSSPHVASPPSLLNHSCKVKLVHMHGTYLGYTSKKG